MNLELHLIFYVTDKTLEEIEEFRSKNAPPETDSAETSLQSSLEIPLPSTVTYVDYEDPFSMIDDTSGAPDIYSLSSFAWVGCGGGVYVLDLLGQGFIRINTKQENGKPSLYHY